MKNLVLVTLLSFVLSSCISGGKKKTIKNYAESEYRLNNGIPQENIRHSEIRYSGEKGKIFIVLEVQPTEVVARPGFNQFQLYNQTLRGIMKTECRRHFKVIGASLGYVENLEIQTQRYSNFSYRTWGKAVCHGYIRDYNYNP